MQFRDEKTTEEKLARQNKLLNLINYKKSVQENVKLNIYFNLIAVIILFF